MQALLSACSHRAPTGVRNRALVAVLYCSGLRLAEALALRPGDVDVAGGRIRVVAQPGRPGREARLFPVALPYVEAWGFARSRKGIGPERPLFCTLRGEGLKDAYVRSMLARLARRAGIGKRVNVQALRASFANRLHRLGLELEVIARQLGHVDARNTIAMLVADRAERREGELARVPWSLAPERTVVRVELVDRPPRSSTAPPPAPPPPAPVPAVAPPPAAAPAIPAPSRDDGAEGDEPTRVRRVELPEFEGRPVG